jgi:glycosyltransferase involved in cell wall biosynthesis
VVDAPYATDYIQELKSNENSNIIFTGYLFGEGYRELSSNAYLFVETSEAGGTHPALLEAMAFRNCVLVNGTAENLETIGDSGFSYDGRVGPESLRKVLAELLVNPERVEDYRAQALERVQREYSWEKITRQYEELFYSLLTAKPSRV